MLACEKELRCILIASPIILKHKLKEVRRLKDSYRPILSIQSHLEMADHKEELYYYEKKPFQTFILYFILLLLYPIVFLVHLIIIIFLKKKEKTEIKLRISEIQRRSQINYNVSENKSFIQLWSDKGLRDYGITHMDEGPYSYEEKFFCLSEWIKILYDEDFDLKKFEKEIREREQMRMKEYLHKNPDIFITPADPIDLIPFAIDSIFGEYIESRKFSIN